ncbi:hypothetical protein [Microvirga tunisiensis]|uniref:Uncharacterized protein n=1 Tax=Microvirga tunisiensis TaxID=2108360 RepID=A0A5N7N1T7_9HYPH|nr:hypothetical protein [Microvirga tunisiensis]MPR11803.1 hypothetical protein [Microvirga tunisiensis]MPR29836.1 hypothetical protein [Microvirga tunisiensis]
MTPFFPCIKPRVVIPDELRHVEPRRSRTGIDIHPLKPEIKEWCQENLRNRYRTHFIKGEELGKMIAVIVFKAAKDAMLIQNEVALKLVPIRGLFRFTVQSRYG